jgi:hypothetical protein
VSFSVADALRRVAVRFLSRLCVTITSRWYRNRHLHE